MAHSLHSGSGCDMTVGLHPPAKAQATPGGALLYVCLPVDARTGNLCVIMYDDAKVENAAAAGSKSSTTYVVVVYSAVMKRISIPP